MADPTHKHDCSQCKFLGIYKPTNDDPNSYDLYACDKLVYTSIIARYGSDGSEYVSMPIFPFEAEKDINSLTASNVMKFAINAWRTQK